jgi:hypothetical protein
VRILRAIFRPTIRNGAQNAHPKARWRGASRIRADQPLRMNGCGT